MELPDGAELDQSARAVAAIEMVERWLLGNPLEALLELLSDRSPDDIELDTDWLHLNEELPDWVEAAVTSGSPTRTLSEGRLTSLRRTLSIERRAAEYFNFRSRDGVEYRERSQAIVASFGETTRSTVEAHAERLGLITPSTPTRLGYDETLILGGGYLSPLLRTRFARLLVDGGVDPGDIYFLGSPRFMIEEPSEREAVRSYAPAAHDEFDLMIAAACAEFGWCTADITLACGCVDTGTTCPRWPFAQSVDSASTPSEYTHERTAAIRDGDGRTRAVALSASTSRPPYRPDTSDTFGLWARCASPEAGDHILVVTTQVFVPFQTFDAVKRLYLPHGVNADVVGFGADWGDRPQTAEYLLQETLSAIRSARRLLVEAYTHLSDN